MYLRRLTVSGFKSFTDKVEIEFDPGVTLVVGPNGCGKSNIADAVRWVLGEQNPRKLRGTRMGDLIFNGTITRPSLGMAQATLVFDNCDRFLPVSYSEVAITRKLFRDGESQYLLNGTLCRLKDITDLFLDSGIGTDAYSLIEQGRVDLIINARPHERREIIEEAAGVSRYLHRQAEALRKLDRTENDLVVVNNVISELERQKRSLERQAKQAERAQRYRRELKIADAIVERRRGRKLLADVAEVESQLKALRKRVAKCEGDLEAVRSGKAELMHVAKDLEGHTRQCRDSHVQLNNNYEQTEKQIEVLRARIVEHRQLAERFRAEAQANRDRSAEEKERVLAADRRLAAISSELATLEEEFVQVEQEAVVADERCQRIAAEEEERRTRSGEVQRHLAEQRDRSREWARDYQFYGSRLEKLSAQREQALADIEAQRSRSEELEAAASEVRKAVSDLVSRLDRLNADLETTQKERDVCARELHETEAAWQQKNSRLESLVRLQSTLEGFAPGVRFLLREQEEPLPGLLHTLAEKLSVEKGFEQAIENALAQELDGIVAEDVDAVPQAVDRLRQEQRGRVAFFTKGVRGESGNDVPEPLSHLRHAPSVIHADDETRELVSRLIGRTFVVKDLEEGLRYWDQLPNGWRIVTQEGDVLDGRGVIIGGTTGETSLLSRAAEIERLRQETPVLATRREELAARVSALRETAGWIERDRDDIREQRMAAEAELRHVEEDLQRLAEQMNRAQTELTAMEEEQAQIDEAIRNGRIEEKERKQILERLAGKESLLNEEIAAWETQITTAEQAKGEIQERLADLRMRVLEQQKDHERWAEQRVTMSRHLQELADDIKEREEFVQQQERREEEIVVEIATLQERLANLRTERDELWSRIQDSDTRASAIRSQIEALESEEQTVLRSIQGLDEERNGLEQQRVRITVEKEYWERRIREMFDGEIPEDLRDQDTRSDEEIEELVATLRRRLDRLGVINELAIEEYEEICERHEFLINQRDDLEKAKAALLETTRSLHSTAVDKFMTTLAQVQENFRGMFRKMFGGGRAEIRLLEGDPIEAGIEIEVQPPGKKLQSISLLSGGEKSLVAIALLFAIYQIKPSPFCLLDEIDAALDDSNISRFTSLLETFTDRCQFILITHNKHTMGIADTIYGVTMEEEGISSIISMKFEDKKAEERKTDEDQKEQERSILEPDVLDSRVPHEPDASEPASDGEERAERLTSANTGSSDTSPVQTQESEVVA